MSRRLLVTDGGRERELLVVATVVVGRDPTCDITGSDDLLSRRHAEFAPVSDRVIVRDLGSRNGIFVNGARVVEVALNSNDVVQIGTLKIRYVSDDRPISRVAIPTPAFSTIDEDRTGYRPVNPAAPGAVASRTDDDVTSFVPSRTARAEAAPGVPPPARVTAPAPIKEPESASGAPALTVPLIPAFVLVVVSTAVLVWEGMRAGMATWLLFPLLSALAAAAGIGAALATRPSGTKSSRKQ